MIVNSTTQKHKNKERQSTSVALLALFGGADKGTQKMSIKNFEDLMEVVTNMTYGEAVTYSVCGRAIVDLVESGNIAIPEGQREHAITVSNSIQKYKADMEDLPKNLEGFFEHFARFVLNYRSDEKVLYVLDGLGKTSSIRFRTAAEEKMFKNELLPILNKMVFDVKVYCDLSMEEMNLIMARLNVSGDKYGHDDMRNNLLAGNPAWEIVRNMVKDEANADILDMMGTRLPKRGTTITKAPLALTEVFYRAAGMLTESQKTPCIMNTYKSLAKEEDYGRRTLTRYFNLMRAIGNYGYHLVSANDNEATKRFVGYYQMRNTKITTFENGIDKTISKSEIKPKRHMMGCLIEALEKEFFGNEFEEISFLKTVAEMPIDKVINTKAAVYNKHKDDCTDVLGSSSCQITTKHAYQLNYFVDLIRALRQM